MDQRQAQRSCHKYRSDHSVRDDLLEWIMKLILLLSCTVLYTVTRARASPAMMCERKTCLHICISVQTLHRLFGKKGVWGIVRFMYCFTNY
jgi:hypothetical protein